MRQIITAVIPALNEERNIARCIESVKWCDRIVVMWMGRDKTGEIAEKLGAEVIKMNSTNKDDFASVQKNINWAIDHCETDWMLRIDADEVVPEDLKNEICSTLDVRSKKIKTSNLQPLTSNIVAYGIPRSQYFCGDFLKGGDWAYDRLVRLFKPQYCRYETIVAVHEQFKVNEKIGYLNNKLLHYSHPTLKNAIDKFQKYTDIEAKELHISKLSAFWNLLTQPTYVFLRWMIWHHGYRDGLRGILAGAMRGWYEFLLYSKYLFHNNG